MGIGGFTGGNPLAYIDVERFLTDQGVGNVSRSGDEVSFSCPFPGHRHGDHRPSARMNSRTTAWICHGCHRTGNAITFVRDLNNVTQGQAVSWIADWQGGSIMRPNETLVEALHRMLSDRPDTIEEVDLVSAWQGVEYPYEWGVASSIQDDYMLKERGFDKDILNDYGIGWDRSRNRITIPIRNPDGELIGIKGRSLDPKPDAKYWVYPPAYSPSRVLYLMERCEPIDGEIIVVEGEFNALKMHQEGYCNAVGMGGSIFSATHARLIRDIAERVILFFDSDSSGSRGQEQAINLLSLYMPVRIVDPHDGDAASMRSDDLHELIANAQDTFTRLLGY